MLEEAKQKVAESIRQMQAKLSQNANSMRYQITPVRKASKTNQSIVSLINRIRKQ